jgi:hypothetical protein
MDCDALKKAKSIGSSCRGWGNCERTLDSMQILPSERFVSEAVVFAPELLAGDRIAAWMIPPV